MRLLIGVSLLALVGCGSDDADVVFIDASWTVRSVTANSPLGCGDLNANAVKTTLTARRTDGGRCSGAMTECQSVFECDVVPADGETRKATGTGTSTPLEPGIYEVQLALANEDLSTTYAVSTPETIDVSLGDKTYSRQFLTDGGVFQFRWRLLGNDNQPRSCDVASVFGVAITVQNEADPSSATSDEVNCEDNATGYSFAFANGSYMVTLEAVNDNGQTQGLSDTLTGQVIMGPNGITDLGTVDVFLQGNP
jgi:hypothetical protein